MDKGIIGERLAKLRKLMEEKGVGACLITKSDPHQSEYADPYWNQVEYISGFTGSAATVVVTADKAGLWSDGRYASQARAELSATGIDVYISSEDCISTTDFLLNELKMGQGFSFNGLCVSAKEAVALEKKLCAKGIEIAQDLDLVSEIWQGREKLYAEKVFDHHTKYCGKSRTDKIKAVREKMEKGSAYFISSLDDIAWLTNLRRPGNPCLCFEAYFFLTENSACLFADGLSHVERLLEDSGIEIKPYSEAMEFLKGFLNNNPGVKVFVAANKTSHYVMSLLRDRGVEIENDITTELKAIKNETELANYRRLCEKDGAAFVKFIKWVKESAEPVTECDASKYLDNLRGEIDTFVTVSFPTICGYGKNGAIIHYSACKESCLNIEKKGLLLVDAGGNYLDGTTDLTRTLAMGEITDEMRQNFTLVLKSHIAMATAKFVRGTIGPGIDALARKPLWDCGLNFNHGTGHGVGFALNVHEGPQSIRTAPNNTILEAGMLLSNEPGYYKDGEYGIRCENIVVVNKWETASGGNFLRFETLSLCPFDLDAIDGALLTDAEKNWLNNYHKEVYIRLSPLLDQESAQWLANETREI